MTMNCLAKPTQQTGEPEAPARASVPERFRRLKRNEVVWSGDFVADERLGFELWEAPDVFRAGSFARPIYQKEETERFRPTSTRKPKQKITAYLKPNCGWSKGVRAILGNHNLPSISSTIRSTTLRYSKRAGRAFRLVSRSTGGLATRIIMSNAWQDPEVPARSATIKPTQAIWQNSSR